MSYLSLLYRTTSLVIHGEISLVTAKLGWHNVSKDVNWLDANSREIKIFLELDPNRDLTYAIPSVSTSSEPYFKADRTIMPSHMPVLASGTLTVWQDDRSARIAIAAFHDKRDGHLNFRLWGWTPDNKPVQTDTIEGHRLDHTKDAEIIAIGDKNQKCVPIRAQRKDVTES